VGNQYHTIYETVKDVYVKLLALGLRALVYNGDTDMACNFLGDQWFVEQLGQKVRSLRCSADFIAPSWFNVWFSSSRQAHSTSTGFMMTRLLDFTSNLATSLSSQ